jgi:hypothetical protein
MDQSQQTPHTCLVKRMSSNRHVTTETYGHFCPEPTESSSSLIAETASRTHDSGNVYESTVAYFEATKHPLANDADAVAVLVEELFDLHDHPLVQRIMQLPQLAQVGVVCSSIERIIATPLVFQSDRSDILSCIQVDTASLNYSLAPGIDCSFEQGHLVIRSINGLTPEISDVFETIVSDVTQNIQIKTTFTRVYRLNVDNAEHLADVLDGYIA